jgi:hypothetical protein
MLAVQVQYHDYKERQRHNLATEQEERRSHQANEAISWANLQEVHRHNIQTESLGWESLNETHRHNLATESIGRTQAAAAMISAKASAKQADIAGKKFGLSIFEFPYKTSVYTAQANKLAAEARYTQERMGALSWDNKMRLADFVSDSTKEFFGMGEGVLKFLDKAKMIK